MTVTKRFRLLGANPFATSCVIAVILLIFSFLTSSGDLGTFGITVLSSLFQGMLLFLVAAGLSIVFGLMDVLNFAQGEMVTLGAYIGLVLSTALGLPFAAIVLFTVLIAAAFGLVPARPQSAERPGVAQNSTHAQESVSTGGAHAAVRDSENRPITAGGFVDTGPVIFRNVAEKAGLTRWLHVMGTPQKQFILETNGSGVGLIDYDIYIIFI